MDEVVSLRNQNQVLDHIVLDVIQAEMFPATIVNNEI